MILIIYRHIVCQVERLIVRASADVQLGRALHTRRHAGKKLQCLDHVALAEKKRSDLQQIRIDSHIAQSPTVDVPASRFHDYLIEQDLPSDF